MADRIAQAAQIACLMEVCAPKPGNVSRLHDFLDLRFEDFLLSAIAIGPAMENAAQSTIGEIIFHAIYDTHRLVDTNTNLGIVLLLSPLVKACADWQSADHVGFPLSIHSDNLREHLGITLANLTVEDARQVYAAIRLAKPGGMGRVSQADIYEEPSITLFDAMRLAKERDSIAGEYASGYQITFEIGFPVLRETLDEGYGLSSAIVQAYLTILSRVPDSLIARKVGRMTALKVSRQAEEVLKKGGVKTGAGWKAIAQMDRKLRDESHRLNPGTTADLTSAAVFVYLLDFSGRSSLPGVAQIHSLLSSDPFGANRIWSAKMKPPNDQ